MFFIECIGWLLLAGVGLAILAGLAVGAWLSLISIINS